MGKGGNRGGRLRYKERVRGKKWVTERTAEVRQGGAGKGRLR